MQIRVFAVLASGIWFTGAGPGFAQTEPDNLWEVTSSMAMEGMRMPGMTVQTCAKAGQSDSLMPPMQGECQFTDRKTVGKCTAR